MSRRTFYHICIFSTAPILLVIDKIKQKNTLNRIGKKWRREEKGRPRA